MVLILVFIVFTPRHLYKSSVSHTSKPMQPKISFTKEIILGTVGAIVMFAIVWVINGPMQDAKLRRIMKEETVYLTRLPAGDEDVIRFADEFGQIHTLKEFEGKPLVMNLWATWCAPCIKELPVLASYTERFSNRVNVISISVDAGGFSDIKAFISKHPMPHPSFYHDVDKGLFRHLKIRGLPTTFILNAQGQTVAKLERGIEDNDKEVLAILDELVKDTPQAETPNPETR